MASRQLKVEIVGDSRSLQRALGSATDSAGKFSSGFAKMGKVVGLAALGAGAAVTAGFIVTLKRGFDELAESQKVMAQTAAVLESTGQAAKVTAGDVTGLAESLSLMSGVDDEVIQSGENLLLTFTKVRNEAGKGNDIFTQTTKIALDMSTALGKDLNSSVLMLGKALQDPTKGMTALGRAGVDMTSANIVLAKKLAETGDVMGAQKAILRELTVEFGGSAKAAGETLPGQLNKLKNAFDEVAGEMAVKFLPLLLRAVNAINENWGTISQVFDTVGTAIAGTAEFAVSAIQRNFDKIKSVTITAFEGAKSAVSGFVNFIRSDLGQQLAISAAGILAVGKAVAVLAPAVKIAMSAFTLMGKSIGAALIPFAGIVAVGALVGELAGNFIKSKLAAQELADSMDRAAGSARGLKDSLDALKDANLGVKEASFAHREATIRLSEAQAAYNKAVADSGPKSQAARDASRELTAAKLAEERADLTLTDATKRQTDAQTARNAKLREGEQALMKLTAEGGRANNTFAQTGAQEKWYQAVKKIGDGAAVTALKAKNMGDEAGSKAAAKVAFLADAAQDLAVKLQRVPSRKEIIAEAKARNFPAFYGSLLEAQAKMQATASAATGIGSDIGSGLNQGMSGWAGTIANTAASLVSNAIAAARAAAKAKSDSQEMVALGRDLVGGLITGIGSKDKELNAKLKSLLNLAEIGAAAKELGAGATREIIKGIVGIAPSLKQQTVQALRDAMTAAKEEARVKAREIAQAIADAISAARGTVASAFEGLISAALSAFDAMAAKWKPPSLKLLDKMEIQEQKQALIDAITRAGEELQVATAAAQAAALGGDPAAIAAAQAQLLAAEKAFSDAKLAQLKANLQEQGRIEQEAHDAQMEKDRMRLEARLKAIQAKYLKEKDLSAAEIRNMNKAIAAAMAEAGVDSQGAGQNISNMLALGIRAAINEVRKAVQELAAVLRKNLKTRSNTEEGPLSDIETWWTGLGATLAAQLKPDEIKLAAMGLGQALMDGVTVPSEMLAATWERLLGVKTLVIAGLGEFVGQATVTAGAIQENLIKPTEDWIARLMKAIQETAGVGAALRALDGTSATIYLYRNVITTYFEGEKTMQGPGPPPGAGQGGESPWPDKIPGYATGAIIKKRTLAWIAEKGAEAVVPLKQSGNLRAFAKSLGQAMTGYSTDGGQLFIPPGGIPVKIKKPNWLDELWERYRPGLPTGMDGPLALTGSAEPMDFMSHFEKKYPNLGPPPAHDVPNWIGGGAGEKGGDFPAKDTGGGDVTLIFNAPIGGEQEFARKYVPAIVDEIRRGHRNGEPSIVRVN